jgi:hypothetical protein
MRDLMPIEVDDAPTEGAQSVVASTVAAFGEFAGVVGHTVELDSDPLAAICKVEPCNSVAVQSHFDLSFGYGQTG